ncbi:MAG TPA: hypothetical protein VF503_23815 [Sphingobium sp.]
MDHGVENDEELSSDGDEDCLWAFPLARILSRMAVRAGMRREALSAATQSFSPPTPYASGAAPCSTFAGVRSEAGERGDLSAAQGAEFGEFAEQCSKDGGVDIGNGREQSCLLGQGLILSDELCDLAVEGDDLLAEQFDHGFDGLRDFGLPGAVTMQLFGLSHIDQLPATAQQIGQA